MKFVKMFIPWVGIMCGMGSMVFHSFLPPIVAALIGFIGLSILVAIVIFLINKLWGVIIWKNFCGK